MEYADYEEHFEMEFPFDIYDEVQSSKNYEKSIIELENMLQFPHNYLMMLYRHFIRYGARPISATLNKKFKAVMDIVNELPTGELKKGLPKKATNKILPNRNVEWLIFVKKITHEKAVIANIELRLEKKRRYINKNIWEYYVEFMRTQNPIAFLNVYRRYCQLFKEDYKAHREYLDEIERIGKMGINVTRYWKECIKFELSQNSNDWAFKLAARALNTVSDRHQLLTTPDRLEDDFAVMMNNIYESKILTKRPSKRRRIEVNNIGIDISNSDKQIKMLFPRSGGSAKNYIDYIVENANSFVLHKLHSSCKYFFNLKPYPVCHRLLIKPYNIKPRYIQQSLFLPTTLTEFSALKDMIVSNSLLCESNTKEGNNGKILVKLKSTLYKCEARYIEIRNQRLSDTDFIFYVKEGNIRFIRLENVEIFNEDKVLLSPRKINEIVNKYNKTFNLLIDDQNFPEKQTKTKKLDFYML